MLDVVSRKIRLFDGPPTISCALQKPRNCPRIAEMHASRASPLLEVGASLGIIEGVGAILSPFDVYYSCPKTASKIRFFSAFCNTKSNRKLPQSPPGSLRFLSNVGIFKNSLSAVLERVRGAPVLQIPQELSGMSDYTRSRPLLALCDLS